MKLLHTSVLALVLLGCSSVSVTKSETQSPIERPPVSADQVVLQTLLESVLSRSAGGRYVIAETSVLIDLPSDPAENSGFAASSSRKVPAAIVASFSTRNSQEERIPGLLCERPSYECTWLSGGELDRLFSDGAIEGWATFVARFPKAIGLVKFSLPGYSPDYRNAVVYWSLGRGALASDGYLSFLQQIDGAWTVMWTEHYLSS